MRIIPYVAATLLVSTAADARCLARLSEPLVFVTSDCDECDQLIYSLKAMKLKPRICNISTDDDCVSLYEASKESDEIPLTFVCSDEIPGNKPKTIMEKIEFEKTQIHPDEMDYGDWEEERK